MNWSRDWTDPADRIPPREPKRLRRTIIAILIGALVLWLMVPRPAPLVEFRVTATQSK